MSLELRTREVPPPPPGLCSGCAFAQVVIVDRTMAAPVLECRRFPPSVVNLAPDELTRLFPQVSEDDWCGEWVADPTPAPRPNPAPGPDEAFPDDMIRRTP